MANRITFNLLGDKALVKALNRLEDKVERRVLTTAVGKAALPIRKAAKALAPKRTGALANSIGIKRYRSKRAPMAIAVIGPRTDFKPSKKVGEAIGGRNIKPAKYAHLVEFGTAPHVIQGAVLNGKGPMTVQHPGTPADRKSVV